MKTIKFKRYQTELVNGSKGTISIPDGEDLRSMIQNRGFPKDGCSETLIRSSAIVKFEHVGYEERLINEDEELLPVTASQNQ
ncbi:hypothetical protein BEP19_15710 [Ammoniphilus oxalaticus]|uniref:Uncharacterized protein n=1 Tax=Ammoniphilus oxalaticus TaxID=66863 RepID=A0A419SDC8_9BACL|nr:hypothetical protein [Ammoniphilus oxalaticus]RKD21119.1 hypothetical protein BEP19_15710 [Ammoniphilus oxalaticus]